MSDFWIGIGLAVLTMLPWFVWQWRQGRREREQLRAVMARFRAMHGEADDE